MYGPGDRRRNRAPPHQEACVRKSGRAEDGDGEQGRGARIERVVASRMSMAPPHAIRRGATAQWAGEQMGPE